MRITHVTKLFKSPHSRYKHLPASAAQDKIAQGCERLNQLCKNKDMMLVQVDSQPTLK